MDAAYHRHDISDAMGALLEDYLPGRKGTWGGNARDNRPFLNACFCWPDYRRLDLMHGGTVARFAPGLRQLEKYAPPDFAAGVTRAYGKNYLSCWSKNPILNG